MKFRHVRAAAIFGVCVVALTGARGHHGGSCGGGGSSHHSSSSSSSSSGGSTSTSGGDSSGGTFGGTTSGGTGSDSTSGGFSTGSTSSGTTTSGDSSSGGSSILGSSGRSRGGSNDAMRDIKINGCTYSSATGITAKLTATNSSASQTSDYSLTVKFTMPEGDTRTRYTSIMSVPPNSSRTADVSTIYVAKPGSTGTFRCSVTNVSRTSR